jgi:hypothetical protein
MRTRCLWVGLLLIGLGLASGPATARAAIWPFSLFTKPAPPVKRHKPKPGKPRPGNVNMPGTVVSK